jgi:hypothetical protein
VDTNWAVTAIRHNAPAPREVLAKLGKALFEQWSTIDDPLSLGQLQSQLATSNGQHAIQSILANSFSAGSVQSEAAIRVINWMRDGA